MSQDSALLPTGKTFKDLDALRRRLGTDEINSLPLFHYEGPVKLVRTPEELDKALGILHREPLLGFDTETQPSFRKGKQHTPSLIQLATADAVFLLQLTWLTLNQDIINLLNNPHIIKAGVAIAEDMRELQRLQPFTPAGLADVGEYARHAGLQSQGLRTLAAKLFGVRISKGSQCSNWSLRVLSQRQVVYAATDAWISRAIYLRMQTLGFVPEAE